MVQFVNSGGQTGPSPVKMPVKLEIEDPTEESRAPVTKRPKISNSPQQWKTGEVNISEKTAYYNPLEEPSPLGLRLKKSPSFLDLIQMKLSQGNLPVAGGTNRGNTERGKKDSKNNSIAATTEKLKASNFPASVLRIGSWECVSRYEGDLVAKCYFAKHKLVWEVLDGGLKSKIEIQWSDISGLKATCPENGPGTLDVVLSRQPLFFRETNPQPRKHTLWQATSDFTEDQASLQRRHFLQCPAGLLGKHFQKLIMCDPRLNMLSQQPEIVLDSPFFEIRGSVFEDPDESKNHISDHQSSEYVSAFVGFRDGQSPSGAQLSSSVTDFRDSLGVAEAICHGTPSRSPVMNTRLIEESGSSKAEESKSPSSMQEFKVPGLHASMSMNDLLVHIGNCISEQTASGNPLLTDEGWQSKDILEEITQYLLSDSQFSSTSDDQSLMSRVNSLCCLLQDSPNVQCSQLKIDDQFSSEDGRNSKQLLMSRVNSLCSLLQKDVPTVSKTPVRNQVALENEDGNSNRDCHRNKSSDSTGAAKRWELSSFGEETSDVSGCRQPPSMPRNDSVGDLLFHLPRVASLPKFLFSNSEYFENKAR